MRRKTSPGRTAYYQLVEASRVNDAPRQRVVLHLGQHRTTEEALKEWPREISRLRRRGRTHDADALKMKLEVLRSVLPHYQKVWRVSKGLENSEGVRWAREKLSGYDWSNCVRVNVGWGKEIKGVWRRKYPGHPRKDEVSLLDPYESRYTGPMDTTLRTGTYTLEARVVKAQPYPTELCSKDLDSPFVMQDEDETLVFLIAFLAAAYLSSTGQISGESEKRSRGLFVTAMIEEFRTFRR